MCNWCGKETQTEYCDNDCKEAYEKFKSWKQSKKSDTISKVECKKEQKLNRYKFAQELLGNYVQ